MKNARGTEIGKSAKEKWEARRQARREKKLVDSLMARKPFVPTVTPEPAQLTNYRSNLTRNTAEFIIEKVKVDPNDPNLQGYIEELLRTYAHDINWKG